MDVADPKRIALAHRNLRKFNQKNNKQIIKILDLPDKKMLTSFAFT